MQKEVSAFAPEAILTIGVAASWMGAAALARKAKIPLYLIVHDEGHYNYFWITVLRDFGTRLFGKAYKQARTRFCISEPMAQLYQQRFGVDGTVMLPLRSRQSLFFKEPKKKEVESEQSKKIIYAGSIYGKGFEELDKLAQALSRHDIKLIAYTPSNFNASQVEYLEVRNALPSDELIQVLHKEANALLLWTAFAEEARENVRTLFPSKMVDYTATGVPIVVVAPEDSCISRYLKDNRDAGYLITDSCPQKNAEQITKLLKDASELERLGKGAIAAGFKDFSFEKNFQKFCSKMNFDNNS